MADPSTVGRKLARKIGSRSAVVTPGPVEAIGVLMTRLMPHTMGRFMSARAEAARARRSPMSDGV
jgi:hypothetical protein